MSTILKALRRLEQEKSMRSDRPLGEAVATAAPVPAPQARGSRRWPMFTGIAIGVIALGVAAFAAIQWSRGGGESPPVEVAAVPVEPAPPEAPAVPGRRRAALGRAKANDSPATRRLRQARDSRARASAPSEPSPETAIPDVAVVERFQPKPAPRLRTSQTFADAASAKSPGSTGVQRRETSPVTPSLGVPPVIDLSQLEALGAAAKSEGKLPESIVPAPVVPSPPATSPPPAEPASPAPVEVAVARPTPEPLPTPAPSTATKSEPTPKAEPKSEAEPKPQATRPVARKSPPRPSSPPPPTVYVSRTVWHPDASRRIAYVEFEGRDGTVALREGESIGPLIVTKIAPTGVSFDNRGSELTRRVGVR